MTSKSKKPKTGLSLRDAFEVDQAEKLSQRVEPAVQHEAHHVALRGQRRDQLVELEVEVHVDSASTGGLHDVRDALGDPCRELVGKLVLARCGRITYCCLPDTGGDLGA